MPYACSSKTSLWASQRICQKFRYWLLGLRQGSGIDILKQTFLVPWGQGENFFLCFLLDISSARLPEFSHVFAPADCSVLGGILSLGLVPLLYQCSMYLSSRLRRQSYSFIVMTHFLSCFIALTNWKMHF